MAIKYLASSSVKMFPSAYRGQSVDAEAYFTTEGNLTKSDVLGFASKSFIDSYDGTNITIVIDGYRFDTTKSAIQALAESGDSEIYADIKTVAKGTSGTFKTLIGYNDTTQVILDDGTYFKGLAFASSKAQLSDNALLVLKLVNGTWGVPSTSKLNVSPSQIRASDNDADASKSLSEKLVTKDIAASGTLDVTGNTSIESNLVVGGAINYQSAETGTMIELLGLDNQGKVIRGTTLTGNLGVTGTTASTGKITGGNGLEISNGNTSLKNTTITGTLSTTGNTTIGGNLEVVGELSSSEGLTIAGELIVNDVAHLKAGLQIEDGNNITVDVDSTNGDINTQGDVSVGGDLTVTGDTTLGLTTDGDPEVLIIDSDGLVSSQDVSSSYTRSNDSGSYVHVLSSLEFNSIGQMTSSQEDSLPMATTTQAGLVSLDSQTFAGVKTFNGGINSQLQYGNFAICTTGDTTRVKEISLTNFPTNENIPEGTHIYVLFEHHSTAGTSGNSLKINNGSGIAIASDNRSDSPLYNHLANWQDGTLVELVYTRVPTTFVETLGYNYWWLATNCEVYYASRAGSASSAGSATSATNAEKTSFSNAEYTSSWDGGGVHQLTNETQYWPSPFIYAYYIPSNSSSYISFGVFQIPDLNKSVVTSVKKYSISGESDFVLIVDKAYDGSHNRYVLNLNIYLKSDNSWSRPAGTLYTKYID